MKSHLKTFISFLIFDMDFQVCVRYNKTYCITIREIVDTSVKLCFFLFYQIASESNLSIFSIFKWISKRVDN